MNELSQIFPGFPDRIALVCRFTHIAENPTEKRDRIINETSLYADSDESYMLEQVRSWTVKSFRGDEWVEKKNKNLIFLDKDLITTLMPYLQKILTGEGKEKNEKG